jgi:hypothetical protein
MSYSPNSSNKWRTPTLWSGVLGFFAAFTLYAITVAPTISWGDSADLAMRLIYDGDTSFIGTHRDYVLWRYLGQATAWFPIEDGGLRANLFNAFWGAVTVGTITAYVYLVSQSFLATIAAGCAIAVAHSFWLLSVIAEVYTFNTAVVFLSFLFVALWWESKSSIWLWAAALFSGLSLYHHATGLVLIAATFPLLLARFKSIGLLHGSVATAIFISASWPYWSVVIPLLGSDENVLAALGLRMPQNLNFETSVLRELIKFFAYLTYNFIGFSIFLGIYGIFVAFRYRIWHLLPPGIWSLAFVYAGTTSTIPDKFNVYVAIYPAFALVVGVGVYQLSKHFKFSRNINATMVLATTLFPPTFYFATVKISERFSFDLVGARTAPLRNNALYFLFPPKNGDFAPRIFAETALQDMPENGVLISDYTLWRPLYYVQAIDGLRLDVELIFVERLLSEGVENWIANQACDRPIFLASNRPASYYQLDQIQARFDVQPYGSIFEVTARCG